MLYKQVKFFFKPDNPENTGLLVARLLQLKFESFFEEEDGLSAFIPSRLLDIGSVKALLHDPLFNALKLSFEISDLPDKNWNEEWEKNYDPVLIEPVCSILAPFHHDTNTEYIIRIEPKMSFGTGHHETTRLMIKHIYDTAIESLTVLDMGCGTGVLGIFAYMRGASFITAIDIDEWAYRNSTENFQVNQVPVNKREILLGGADSIPVRGYDIILANINLNILLQDMNKYIARLNPGGVLIFSGLLSTDRQVFLEAALGYGISFVSELCENNWISLKFST